jgi:hypothetical protein
MRWVRLSIGLILAAISGVTFGHAWAADVSTWWWAGGMTLLAAVLFILSSLYAPREVRIAALSAPARVRKVRWGPLTTPLLGEMLVSRTMLTRQGLAKALSLQRGTTRRLGEILVEMGLITGAELARVLEEQIAEREGRFAWRGHS